MNNDAVIITQEGLDKLRSELAELIDVKRPEVAQKIKEAREMGDISENSAYDTAVQEKSYIEGRIAELEEIIKAAKVSKETVKGAVSVGSMVTVHIDGGEEIFHIVGAPEANPMEKKISHESPLGASLIGKKVGEKVEVEVPIGKIVYTILRIE